MEISKVNSPDKTLSHFSDKPGELLPNSSMKRSYRIRSDSIHGYCNEKLMFRLTIVFDLLMVISLTTLACVSITRSSFEVLDAVIIWANFTIAIFQRIVLIGARIGFEYILQRVRRSTIYSIMTLLSFTFSAHCLPYNQLFPLIVLIADVGLFIILVMMVGCFKCCVTKHHNSLKWKQRFEYLVFFSVILYGAFLITFSCYKHVQRTLYDDDYLPILFYFECAHFVLYAILTIIYKARSNGSICSNNQHNDSIRITTEDAYEDAFQEGSNSRHNGFIRGLLGAANHSQYMNESLGLDSESNADNDNDNSKRVYIYQKEELNIFKNNGLYFSSDEEDDETPYQPPAVANAPKSHFAKKGIIFNSETNIHSSIGSDAKPKENIEHTFREAKESARLMNVPKPKETTQDFVLEKVTIQKNYDQLQVELEDIKNTLEKLEQSSNMMEIRNVSELQATDFSSLNYTNYLSQTGMQTTDQASRKGNLVLDMTCELNDLNKTSALTEQVSSTKTRAQSVSRLLSKKHSLTNSSKNNLLGSNKTQLIKNLKRILGFKKAGIPYIEQLFLCNTKLPSKLLQTNKSPSGHTSKKNSIAQQEYSTFQAGRQSSMIHTQDGEGVLQGHDNTMSYKGRFKEGKKHGQGQMTQIIEDYLGNGPRKAVIKSQWKDGFMSGMVTISIQSANEASNQAQDSFEATFKKGQASGFGILRFHSGDSYQGFFKKSMKQGKGKYVAVSETGNKFRYSGLFDNNQADGQGILQYMNGHVYQGTINRNKLSGYGLLQFKNGASYEGQLALNKPEGKGKLMIPQTTQQQSMYHSFSPSKQAQPSPVNHIYFGEFKQGKYNGKGQFTWGASEEGQSIIYEGSFTNGQIGGGKGSYYFNNNKNIIHAFFRDNQPQGQAYKKQLLEDKTVMYKGNLDSQTLKMNGFGEIIWNEANKKQSLQSQATYLDQNFKEYIGEIQDDTMQGQGQLSLNDQKGGMTQYSGQFRKNLFCGKGELYYANGDRYSGMFRDGLFEGEGTYTFNNDLCVYSGEFREGKFHGKGTLKAHNMYIIEGIFYDGSVANDKSSKIKFTNGDEYQGQLKDLKMDGFGCYFQASDNVKLIGTFSDGVPQGNIKKLYYMVGSQDKVQRIAYGIHQNGKLSGKVLELIKDPDTQKTLSKHHCLYSNGQKQEQNCVFTFQEEENLKKNTYFDQVLKFTKNEILIDELEQYK